MFLMLILNLARFQTCYSLQLGLIRDPKLLSLINCVLTTLLHDVMTLCCDVTALCVATKVTWGLHAGVVIDRKCVHGVKVSWRCARSPVFTHKAILAQGRLH